MLSESHVCVGIGIRMQIKSTEEKCAKAGGKYAFIGSCLLFVKNAGTDRGGGEHERRERCRCVADEPREVAPVVHDRCQIGSHVTAAQVASTIAPARAGNAGTSQREGSSACTWLRI